jgi:hypothetical protein
MTRAADVTSARGPRNLGPPDPGGTFGSMYSPGARRACRGRGTTRPRGTLALALAIVLLLPAPASAWVSAYLERVETTTSVAADGTATTEATGWYVIEAGKFREFRLLEVPADVEPDLAASWVEDGEGRRYGVELQGKRHADGILRLQLAGEARIGKGRATCRLVLRENWVAAGRARRAGETVEVDWRPAVWPDGMERLTARISFAGEGGALQFSIPGDLVAELEPRSTGRTLTLSKFRPAALYVLPVRFTARPAAPGGPVLVADAPTTAASSRPHHSRAPGLRERADVFPFLVALPLLGGALLGLRVRHARRVAPAEGGVQTYLVVPSLGAPLRWPLVAVALSVGAWLLLGDNAPAGFVVQAAGVLLALPDRFRWLERGATGAGPWRALAAPSPRTWRSLSAAAHRARRSVFDATGPAGQLLLLLVVGAVAAAMQLALGSDVRAWIVVAADAALLLLPPFLVAPERALPPVLPAESGAALERVRRSFVRAGRGAGGEVSFLVQDDAAGRPAELRMRVRRATAKFARHAEVAVEWRLTRWGWHPTFVLLVELPAGSRLRCGPSGFPRGASCRLAAELDRETWLLRAPTPRAAARRLAAVLDGVERLLSAPVPPSAPRPTLESAAPRPPCRTVHPTAVRRGAPPSRSVRPPG